MLSLAMVVVASLIGAKGSARMFSKRCNTRMWDKGYWPAFAIPLLRYDARQDCAGPQPLTAGSYVTGRYAIIAQAGPGRDRQDINNAVLPDGNQSIEHIHHDTYMIGHNPQNVAYLGPPLAFSEVQEAVFLGHLVDLRAGVF